MSTQPDNESPDAQPETEYDVVNAAAETARVREPGGYALAYAGGRSAEPRGGGGEYQHLVSGLIGAVLERMEKVLRQSLTRMSPEEVMRAVAAENAAETVAEVLLADPDVGAAEQSAWVRGLLRGARHKRAMLELAGGVMSSSEVSDLLGISVQAVKQRIERRTILAVPLAGGAWGFPAKQFDADGRVRTGVAEVLKSAPDVNPWVILSVLVDASSDERGGTVLENLEDAGVRAGAVALLAGYGEQGAA